MSAGMMALKKKSGPKPERVKLQGDWREAMKKAPEKKSPKKKNWLKPKPAK